MNFDDQYELSALHLEAIRRLVDARVRDRFTPRLVYVDLDGLRSISTPAALALTAELSRWDDSVRKALTPRTERWDPDIRDQFAELGFFDLFAKADGSSPESQVRPNRDLRLVRYIKGRCGDGEKVGELKRAVYAVVGDDIDKWTFLNAGLGEAVTNVSHWAYPERLGYSDEERLWYLTGSYNVSQKRLKIVFLDQGIGIPAALPSSKIWERVLDMLSRFPVAERRRHEVLLRAAVEADRTATGEEDRGKGLQDMLEFIRKRGDGYLSILSLKGLYKLTVVKGKEVVTAGSFRCQIQGTLIIWSVTLNDSGG